MISKKIPFGFWFLSIGLLFFLSNDTFSKEGDDTEFAFGVIADCQYAAVKDKGRRK